MASGNFPDAQSSDLCLAHPLPGELTEISKHTAVEWQDALSTPAFLEEFQYMTTAPLARDGGMTNWILVDERLAPGKRQILSSCETFRKRALKSDNCGNVIEVIVYGIASVFCLPQFRGHGYPKRMMRELASKFQVWQAENYRCIGSVLYSDIGKDYYAKLGWQPDIYNTHLEMKPIPTQISPSVRSVLVTDIPALCEIDETQIRSEMAIPTIDPPSRVSIIPDVDHIGWHHAKEDFACNHIFGKSPESKGAIAGSYGSRVWAIWTRRYYDDPDASTTNNVLYILRLVFEGGIQDRSNPDTYEQQSKYLKHVIQAAQNEAFAWKLATIRLWNPAPAVQDLLKSLSVMYDVTEREHESIASGMWYDDKSGISDVAPLWLNNEHFAWC
jgi:GNAT superfamily N-acetyltransferase